MAAAAVVVVIAVAILLVALTTWVDQRRSGSPSFFIAPPTLVVNLSIYAWLQTHCGTPLILWPPWPTTQIQSISARAAGINCDGSEAGSSIPFFRFLAAASLAIAAPKADCGGIGLLLIRQNCRGAA